MADPLGLFGGAPAGSTLFADPFAGVQAGPAAPAARAAPPPAAGDDPFAVFLASARPAPAAPPDAAAHDPFAPPPAPPPARVVVLGLGARRASSVAALFGHAGCVPRGPCF